MDSAEYRGHVLRTWRNELLWGHQLVNGGLGLSGESGEVADLIKKCQFHGQPLDEDQMLKELGDVRYYLEIVAHLCGLTMDEIEAANVEKLRQRHPNGFSPSYHNAAQTEKQGVDGAQPGDG